MSIEGNVILKRLDDDEYEVVDNIKFVGSTMTVTIKAGMVTDGASIPRPFWVAIGSPFRGKYLPAAIAHDGLYSSEAVGRKEADDFFKEMMKDLGVASWRRLVMWGAVRLGGYFVWKGHTAANVAAAKEYVEVELNG